MASAIKISTSARNAALAAIATRLQTTWVSFYSGSPPADVNSTPTGSLLCTIITVSGWGTPSNGEVQFNCDTDLVTQSGVVGYFRVENFDGTIRLQGTVDLSENNPDWIVPIKNWNADGWIDPFTATLVWPE